MDVTRAVRERLGLDELYVADLDAITGAAGHPRRGRAGAGGKAMVDAGAATRKRSRGCSTAASRAS